MKFASITASDLAVVARLRPEGWPDISPAFRFYTENAFCHPFKVVLENRIAGIGCAILHEKTAWLAHIIVPPQFRGSGIGTAIVNHLEKTIAANGIETSLLIATPLGEPIYQKAGFRKVCDYRFFKKQNHSASSYSQSRNIVGATADIHGNMIKLDELASGESRERVLRLHLDEARVFLANGKIEGFYLPTLGDGPIVARTKEAGIALMEAKYASAEKAVVPDGNAAAIEFLIRNGFVESHQRGVRMVRGSDVDFKPEMIFSRIGGNLG